MVFSGSVLKRIIEKFNSYGIKVVGIKSCISTINSYDYFNKNLVLGLECGYLMTDDVIDQICERDFYFGIAQSGILKKDANKKIYKSPYFKPFGNPAIRASIPKEYERIFSRDCINRSILLWVEIEKISKKEFFIKDLPERIIYTDLEEEIIKKLRKEVKKL